MNFLDRVQAGLKASFRFSGSGVGAPGSELWGWPMRTLAGSDYDYRSEAGLLWENGAFAACLRWLSDTWTEAPMVVRRRDDSNRWVPVPQHPAEVWFNEPSPYYDAGTLWFGTLLSLKAAGNAYWYKIRSRGGKMVGVVYLPHFLVTPKFDTDGQSWIDWYEYRPDSQRLRLEVKDVVHLRLGIDPLSMRLGLRTMDAVLREICTENEIATFHAALLRNGGFPGAIVSPDGGANGGVMPELTKDQREQFKALWKEKFSRDGAGDVFVQSIPVKVQVPGWKPSEMMMDKVRGLNAAYICAAFGLDPMVVGLPGDSKTYNNYEEARTGAYDGLLLPMHRTIGRQLDRQILPEIIGSNPVNERIGWDYQDVRNLQDDRTKMYPVLTQAAGKSWLTVNEARAIADLPPVSGGDDLQPDAPILPPQVAGSPRLEPAPDISQEQKALKAAPETPEEQRRRRDRDLLLLMLAMLIDDTDRRLTVIATALAAHEMTISQWRQDTQAALTDAHTSAAYIGRRRAGDDAPMGPQDAEAGQAVADTQAPFLDGFEADLRGGRYDVTPEAQPPATTPTQAPGETPATPEQVTPSTTPEPATLPPTLDIDAIVRRTHLYAQRLRGTAEEQWARSQPDGTRFTWVMGGNEDHCEDCPRLAAGGVYTIDNLPTFPGAGDTECMVNCLCHLETDTGAVGFERGDVVTVTRDGGNE